MFRRPPERKLKDKLFPYTTLFRSGVEAARKTAWKGPIAPRVRSTVATTAALLLSHGKCAHRGKRGHGSSPTIAAIVSWLREEPVGSGKPAAEIGRAHV